MNIPLLLYQFVDIFNCVIALAIGEFLNSCLYKTLNKINTLQLESCPIFKINVHINILMIKVVFKKYRANLLNYKFVSAISLNKPMF